MSVPNNEQNEREPISPIVAMEKTFPEDYVRALREENAGWRVKVRDLDNKQKLLEINLLLDKRGIKADPKWVELKDKESVEEAVQRFSELYPHLIANADVGNPGDGTDIIAGVIKKSATIGKIPKAASNLPIRNQASDSPGEIMRSNQIEEIKKDPKARAALRSEYRSLLAGEGHRNITE